MENKNDTIQPGVLYMFRDKTNMPNKNTPTFEDFEKDPFEAMDRVERNALPPENSEIIDTNTYKQKTSPSYYADDYDQDFCDDCDVDEDCEDCPYGNPKVNLFGCITEEMMDLYARKNHDYGDSFSEGFSEYGMMSVLPRLGDKYRRIKSLCMKDTQQVNNESIEDTLLDLANYAIMTVMELRLRSDKEHMDV